VPHKDALLGDAGFSEQINREEETDSETDHLTKEIQQEFHLQIVALVTLMDHFCIHSRKVSLVRLCNHHPESPCGHTLWPQSGMQELSYQRRMLDG
jgi:hypothetical protein